MSDATGRSSRSFEVDGEGFFNEIVARRKGSQTDSSGETQSEPHIVSLRTCFLGTDRVILSTSSKRT